MAPISAEQVVKFLEENPDFFLDNPELVQTSGLLKENESGENLIDIRTRLFDRLNDERLELMALLDETIELVRQNEQIEGDFLAIETLLFRPAPTGTSLTRIAEEIEERFSLAHVSFLICAPAKEALREEIDEQGRIRLINENDGEMPGDVLLAGGLEGGGEPPFPEDVRSELRSTAIIPLHDGERLLGLLLLGSKDPERYTPGMATQLLERLATRMGMGISLLLRMAEAVGTGSPDSIKPAKKKKTPQNLPDPHGA